MPGLTVKDLEHLQAQLPDYRMELVNSEVMVISPSGYVYTSLLLFYKMAIF